jgi:type IV secretory pathway VirD2 relaxase
LRYIVDYVRVLVFCQSRANSIVMSEDESSEFRPRLGKPRGQGRRGPRTTTALILRAAAKQGADLRRLSRPARERKPSGRFNARGRGRAAAAALQGHGDWQSDAGPDGMRFRARRVVVKARVVKLKGAQSQAIATHLRYLQREGVTLDGNRGQAYSPLEDRADTKAFAERGQHDRHQFRFIVAAEDGVALGDLKPFTRRLMRRMEQDLDTTLDWIAVDHYNTGQPHTHVVVRGVTDENKLLYIAGDYIAHGVRARARDLVTRELGQQSELELQQKLGREVDSDRFTRLDGALIAAAQDGRIDLRVSPHQSYLVRVNRHLLIGRLEKLAAMELATPAEPGVWELSPKLKPVLTHIAERIDTIQLMRDALGEQAAERALSTFLIHREIPPSQVTGELVGKGLAGDGLDDKVYLVIDGVDARVHYLEMHAKLVPDEAQIGTILAVGRDASARSVDKTIAAYAARNDGFYEPREHVEIIRATGRIPGSDVEGHVEAHVRRLEALRRAGIAQRLDADHWHIPPAFLERAAAYDRRASSAVVVEVRSAISLDRQVTVEAATWLDHQLVGRHRVETAPMAFGGKVQRALQQRQQELIALGLAKRHEHGRIQYQADLLSTLQRRELGRAGQYLAAKHADGRIYVPTRDGTTVQGTYSRAIMLASGKFAVIQRNAHFTLVPWRTILERYRGQEVVGIMRGMGVSWQLGRQRDRGISR